MSYGRRLTHYCDWSTGLSLNAGHRLLSDATSSGCGSAVVTGGGIKLDQWFLEFPPPLHIDNIGLISCGGTLWLGSRVAVRLLHRRWWLLVQPLRNSLTEVSFSITMHALTGLCMGGASPFMMSSIIKSAAGDPEAVSEPRAFASMQAPAALLAPY